MIKMTQRNTDSGNEPRRERVKVKPISSDARGTTRVEKSVREVKERKSR